MGILIYAGLSVIIFFIICVGIHEHKKRQHSPDKFKLRIIPRWDNSDYVKWQYTSNGISWSDIYECKLPIYPGDCYRYEPITYKYSPYQDFSDIRSSKFTSIDIVNDHNNTEYQKFVEGNKQIEKIKEAKTAERIEYIKRMNEQIESRTKNN